MVVSFHPIYTTDHNIICAGRPPSHSDLEAIRRATAVILPQGCSRALYQMARANCRHVFPNYDVRFKYPGKLGQIRLFDNLGLAYPHTEIYSSVNRFRQTLPKMTFPWVIKLNWGGEGNTVFKVDNIDDLETVLKQVKDNERSGQWRFAVQEWVPSANRCLRVVVIGRHIETYWRVQTRSGHFGTALAVGGRIDTQADPDRQAAGRRAARQICDQTGLQLIGMDFIFDSRQSVGAPALILELNYYFGRKGLGGSDRFYRLLVQEINTWLLSLDMRLDINRQPQAGTT
jgi:ribosomal protein S6--L-glutamate ligase